MSGKILFIDDDATLRRLAEAALVKAGLHVVMAADGEEGLRLFETEKPSTVLLDLSLPDLSGKEILKQIQEKSPGLPVIVLTASMGVEDVVECMRLGAFDYVQKPFDATRVVTSVRNAKNQSVLQSRVETLTSELRKGDGFGRILGESTAMKKAVQLLARAAQSDVTVLLTGESGTGKEVAARAVHAESARRSAPFVAVNCGAIPEGLIESELFGHEKGAFTGATSDRAGRFEQADGGTLFLDEIGELRTDLQVRLLRVLQERCVQRVGGSSTIPLDTRIIAATNRDLKIEAQNNNFREDLYFRLAVFPVELPPLRDRDGDVIVLARAFMSRFAARHGKVLDEFTPEAQIALSSYAWPGNVRELENVIERAMILEDGDQLSLGSLADEIVCTLDSGRPGGGATSPSGEEAAPSAGLSLDAPVEPEEILPFEEEERRIILRALGATSWNIQETAARLQIGRATIYRKIEKYGLKSEQA